MTLALGGPGGRSVVRRLPASLTVGRLKALVERLLRVPAAEQALALALPDGAPPEDITGEDGRELSFFGLRDGARVEVARRDAAAAAAAGAEAAAQRAREAAHEEGRQRLHAEEARLMA